jgi:hypothetical protein
MKERGRLQAFALPALAACTIAAPAAAQVSPGPLARPHRDLEGNANCLRCHAGRKEGMDARCLDCHREIALLRQLGRGYHARTGDAACARCHPDHAGEDFELVEWPGVSGTVEQFDHALTGWPLAGRHGELECRDCHRTKYRSGAAAALARVEDPARSWLGLETACVTCHADPHEGRLGADCAKCHGDDGWKPVTGFDHAATSFPLTGRHVGVACAACHRKDPAAAPVYRPVPHAGCAPCHADVHAGRLGPRCDDCHTTVGFREVARSAFDHDRTRYPLRGAHRAVACERCHAASGADRARPRFAECADCHADPHAGRASLAGAAADCSDCHSLEGFRPGRLEIARHAPGRFPLEGRHASVACAACHRRDATAEGRKRLGAAAVEIHPAHQGCASCHTDAHGGQLRRRPDGIACESCHAVSGWKPSTFTVARHRTLAFPLDGAHAGAPCAACHGPVRPGLAPLPANAILGSAGIALVDLERDCARCHADPHRFEAATTACTDCHDTGAFVPSRYDAIAHARSAFALEGAHRAVACPACHAELRAPRTASSLIRAAGPRRTLAFRIAGRACADCHTDPHGGQFVLAAGTVQDCAACHDAGSFRPASRFEHDRDSAFRLGGAHANVACSACHPAQRDAAGHEVRRYRGITTRCADCHGPQMLPGGPES